MVERWGEPMRSRFEQIQMQILWVQIEESQNRPASTCE